MSNLVDTVENSLATGAESVVVDTKAALAAAQAKFDAAKTEAQNALRELNVAITADATRAKTDAAKVAADAKAAKSEFLKKFGFFKRLVYRVFYEAIKEIASKA
jgi:hypothetical protein